jgi:hypothetical protein
MKKRIEIEFDCAEFTDKQMDELNKALTRAIYSISNFSNPKKVTVDGNVFWLRTKAPSVGKIEGKYPVHHEEHIVMNIPRWNRDESGNR